ncbi:MAG: hypothetical protein V4547_17240 [Bacteroidota bacterium]
MIKAIQGNRIILGLSDENLERLKKDQPIKFNLKELGLQDVEVFIFNGKTEQVMQKMMIDAGLIHPTKTKINDSRAEQN